MHITHVWAHQTLPKQPEVSMLHRVCVQVICNALLFAARHTPPQITTIELYNAAATEPQPAKAPSVHSAQHSHTRLINLGPRRYLAVRFGVHSCDNVPMRTHYLLAHAGLEAIRCRLCPTYTPLPAAYTRGDTRAAAQSNTQNSRRGAGHAQAQPFNTTSGALLELPCVGLGPASSIGSLARTLASAVNKQRHTGHGAINACSTARVRAR